MAKFDFIRIAINPNIRPAPAEMAAKITDTPEQGTASIGGTGGGVIDLPYSIARSITRQHNQEEKRVFDKIRVFGTRGGSSTRSTKSGGSVDRSTYYEVEVARQITFSDESRASYAEPPTGDNIELISEGNVRYNK